MKSTLLIASVACFACGGSSPPRRYESVGSTATRPRDETIARERTELIEQANADVATIEDAAQRLAIESEWATAIRILDDAAIEESNRRIAETVRDRTTADAEAAIVAAHALEEELNAVSREAALELARAAAIEQRQAALDAALRVTRGRVVPGDSGSAWALPVLREHAAILAEAARSLHATPADLATLREALAKLESSRDERTSLRERFLLVTNARALIDQVFASARRERASVTAEERAVLLEQGIENGTRVVQVPHGLAIVFSAQRFASRENEIASMLRSHPHGPVRIEVGPRAPTATTRSAAALARLDGSRITVARVANLEPGSVRIVFVAY